MKNRKYGVKLTALLAAAVFCGSIAVYGVFAAQNSLGGKLADKTIDAFKNPQTKEEKERQKAAQKAEQERQKAEAKAEKERQKQAAKEAKERNQVGKPGPGGGVIYAVSKNTAWEVSGNLGANTWKDARIAAANYKGGGFSNWSMPGTPELAKIRKKIAFADWFWSSYGSFDEKVSVAEAYNFSTGKKDDKRPKSDKLGTIAIRDYTF